MTPKLREYQVSGIENLRAEFGRGAKRVLLVLPTGGGKTILAADVIRAATLKGTRVLFLAHRRELIQQTSEKLHLFGVSHGIIQAGKSPDYSESVQVASVQTLVRRFKDTGQFDLVFIDEAHHASAGSYLKTLEAYPKAKVIGLTATPWRLDGKGLSEIFDAHVQVSTPLELRDMGYLCPARAFTYEAVSTDDVRVIAGDFDSKALAENATLIIGDVVQQFKEHSHGARGILFACNVAHSKQMATAFMLAGIQAEHVDGEMSHSQRAAIFARLRNGVTRVLTNCGIATEGFDLPELTVCMLTRPTLSESLFLQMVGRVLRPAKGKTEARIHDHAGLLENFGHPFDAGRDFSPKRTVLKSKKEFKRQRELSLGLEKKPKSIEQIMEARAIEVEARMNADAERKKKEENSPQGRMRRFQKIYWNEELRYQQFVKLARKHGSVDKGARAVRWQSGDGYIPSGDEMADARDAMTVQQLPAF